MGFLGPFLDVECRISELQVSCFEVADSLLNSIELMMIQQKKV